MKCIKSIKSTKNTEIGVIKRINDKEADSEVKSGYWKYVPKSEWKSEKKSSAETVTVENINPTKQKTNKKNKK